eukprot:3704516-Prymnesium_polylepis.2
MAASSADPLFTPPRDGDPFDWGDSSDSEDDAERSRRQTVFAGKKQVRSSKAFIGSGAKIFGWNSPSSGVTADFRDGAELPSGVELSGGDVEYADTDCGQCALVLQVRTQDLA